MQTATIVQFKHETLYKINEVVRTAQLEYEYKIVFSQPSEYLKFLNWVKKHKGEYKFNKETCINEGKLPKLKSFEIYKGDYCWCDVMAYYLTNEEFILNSVSESGKFKIYSK